MLSILTLKTSPMKNTYYYLRISTVTQKFDRQELTIPKGASVFKDTCKGSVAFEDRPQAQELMKLVKAGDTIIVQHLDRLGRNTSDMHRTLDKLTDLKVNIRIEKLKIDSLDDEGKPSLMFKLVAGLLAVLSEHEKLMIAERRDAGIKSAKDDKLKYAGRPSGTKDSPEKFLAKHSGIVKAMKKFPDASLRDIAKQATSGDYQPSPNTVKRVKELLTAQESI
jgi:DNA invertase Pin-like site-specific DNA recombinase